MLFFLLHIVDPFVLFLDEGQNVMVKGDKDTETEARKVPLCNRCITLYHTKGWLVIKENMQPSVVRKI